MNNFFSFIILTVFSLSVQSQNQNLKEDTLISFTYFSIDSPYIEYYKNSNTACMYELYFNKDIECPFPAGSKGGDQLISHIINEILKINLNNIITYIDDFDYSHNSNKSISISKDSANKLKMSAEDYKTYYLKSKNSSSTNQNIDIVLHNKTKKYISKNAILIEVNRKNTNLRILVTPPKNLCVGRKHID
jgi:hypothetical protein